MGLDKDLNTLLDEVYASGSQDPELEMYGMNEESIEQIKQAFIKAGWVKPDPTRILGDE